MLEPNFVKIHRLVLEIILKQLLFKSCCTNAHPGNCIWNSFYVCLCACIRVSLWLFDCLTLP